MVQFLEFEIMFQTWQGDSIFGFFVPFLSDLLLPYFFCLILYSHLTYLTSAASQAVASIFLVSDFSSEAHFAFCSFLSPHSSFFHLYPSLYLLFFWFMEVAAE